LIVEENTNSQMAAMTPFREHVDFIVIFVYFEKCDGLCWLACEVKLFGSMR
jgi:hypothetical protein